MGALPSKADRARAMLAAATVARQAAFPYRNGSLSMRCRNCELQLLRYDGPIGLVVLPCRRCGIINDLTTEPNAR